ncbi:MAG: hypothetical protein LAO20_01995 [Acidobacteriia bacterium]|nr:hypothetical protein [Terriglobia bacterium]
MANGQKPRANSRIHQPNASIQQCAEFMLKNLKVALIRRFARKRLGKDIAPLETLATNPDVLIPYTQFSMALDKTRLAPRKLKVLAQIRAAKLVECPF